jgi:hypothetical protein
VNASDLNAVYNEPPADYHDGSDVEQESVVSVDTDVSVHAKVWKTILSVDVDEDFEFPLEEGSGEGRGGAVDEMVPEVMTVPYAAIIEAAEAKTQVTTGVAIESAETQTELDVQRLLESLEESRSVAEQLRREKLSLVDRVESLGRALESVRAELAAETEVAAALELSSKSRDTELQLILTQLIDSKVNVAQKQAELEDAQQQCRKLVHTCRQLQGEAEELRTSVDKLSSKRKSVFGFRK